jgi:hypothetical protein
MVDHVLASIEADVGKSDISAGDVNADDPAYGEKLMEEPSAASRDVGLVFVIHSVLEELGVTDALALGEAVALCRDHPRWAVWLPTVGGRWAAVRPAGVLPPGPEVPTLWVDADTADELRARMQQADAGLLRG